MSALETEAKASELLVFAIDDSRYGLPAHDVVELTRAVAIAPLPQSRKMHLLEGVVNYHGELAAAVNLRSRFGHADKPLDASEHFIFTRTGHHLVALRADRVIEIIKAPIDALDIMTASPPVPDQGQSLAGVCKLSDGLVFIFDLKNFLSPAEARALKKDLHDFAKQQGVQDEP